MTQFVELALRALYQVVTPVFLVFGVGFVAGRKLFPASPARLAAHLTRDGMADTGLAAQATAGRLNRLEDADTTGLRTLSKLVFYVFSPCLTFDALSKSDVQAEEFGKIGVFALTSTLVIGFIAWTLATRLRLSPTETGSLLLVAMFGNVGNFGIPLSELAFGPSGLDRAIIYFVVSSILLFSLGVLVAARAQGGTATQTLARILRVPVVHALWLAGLFRLGVLPVPEPALKAMALLSQATVPLMLLILGLQLSRVRMRGSWRLVSLATGVRLLVAPLFAVLLAPVMGLTGLPGQVLILEASMPSAVYAIILAVEFDLALDLASSVVFLTTLISPVTLIPLISYFG